MGASTVRSTEQIEQPGQQLYTCQDNKIYIHTHTHTTAPKYIYGALQIGVYLDSDIHEKVEQPRQEGTRGGRQRGHDFPRVRLRVARAHQA
jgi:hypothetical protein